MKKVHFYFSCTVLDTSFKHLIDDELKSKGRLFLDLDTEWEGKRGEEVLNVQEKSGMKARFTSGGF